MCYDICEVNLAVVVILNLLLPRSIIITEGDEIVNSSLQKKIILNNDLIILKKIVD